MTGDPEAEQEIDFSRYWRLLAARWWVPVGGIVLFFFPLYYQYVKFQPTYPIKYANWIAIGWVVVGVALAIWLSVARPDRLRDMDRVYVDDETVGTASAAGIPPVI